MLPKYFQLRWLIFFFALHSTFSAHSPKKVLVIGGSGRVGGSAVRALFKRSFQDESESLRLTVAGRSVDSWHSTATRLSNSLRDSKTGNHQSIKESIDFVPLDIHSESDLERIIPYYDLIVHTAGPFQQLKNPNVLNTAMKYGKLYLDVCDDIKLSEICRSEKFQAVAKANSGVAIISTGIWPGASSLLAQVIKFTAYC
jgi:saccharopine dehydrogenase-like NADP-dependent oxidoreductase